MLVSRNNTTRLLRSTYDTAHSELATGHYATLERRRSLTPGNDDGDDHHHQQQWQQSLPSAIQGDQAAAAGRQFDSKDQGKLVVAEMKCS